MHLKRALKHTKQILGELKRQLDNSPMAAGNFNIKLLITEIAHVDRR